MAQAGALRRRVLFCGVAGLWAPLGWRRTRRAPVAAQSLVRGQFFGLVFQALPSQTLVHLSGLVPCLTSLASVLSHSAVSLCHASVPLHRLFALLGSPSLTCRDTLCERGQHWVKRIISA